MVRGLANKQPDVFVTRLSAGGLAVVGLRDLVRYVKSHLNLDFVCTVSDLLAHCFVCTKL
jgi:hypothetical protein